MIRKFFTVAALASALLEAGAGSDTAFCNRRSGNEHEKEAQQRTSNGSAQDIYGFIYRSWVKNRGLPHDQFDDGR